MDATLQLGFPLWVRLTHFFNFLFLSLLIRSGLESSAVIRSFIGVTTPCPEVNGSG
jgi:hypothetical protein